MSVKVLLAIAAFAAAGYNLWAAPQIYRLAKTPPTDPSYNERVSRMNRLQRAGKWMAVAFFCTFLTWLLLSLSS